MLHKTPGRPVWRQIRDHIESEVRRGGLVPGQRLPSEGELAERFEVNRHTVRRALAALAADGLLRTERGRGSFVRETVIDYAVQKRTRFSSTLLAQERAPGAVFIDSREIAAEDSVAEALRLRPGDPVILLRTLGEADDRRISVSNSYFPARRFSGFASVYREQRSVTRTLKHFGVLDYSRRTTRIFARLPSTEEAEWLRQPRNRPVLVTEAVNVDPQGDPTEFGVTAWASDRVQIVVGS